MLMSARTRLLVKRESMKWTRKPSRLSTRLIRLRKLRRATRLTILFREHRARPLTAPSAA